MRTRGTKMVNKKQKQHQKERGKRTHKKSRVKECTLEISQTRSDVKAFIDKFKSDVDKKKKAYQAYASKISKKKTSAQQ